MQGQPIKETSTKKRPSKTNKNIIPKQEQKILTLSKI